MEYVEWVKESAGHYFAKDGDWRVDYDIGGNLWQMRIRGLHVGNAHTLSAGKARIGDYDPQPAPDAQAGGGLDADAVAMLATVGSAYLTPDQVTPGAAYFVTFGPNLSAPVRQAVQRAMEEIGASGSCAITWVHALRAWHVALRPEAEWPVNALAELLYMKHVAVHRIAVTAIDTVNEPPHTETDGTPPDQGQEHPSVTTKTARHHQHSDATALVQETARIADSPSATPADAALTGSQTPQEGTAPELDDEFASLPPPVAHNPGDSKRDYRFDAIAGTSEHIRQRAEQSLAVNAKRVAAKDASTAARPRVNYHWDIQPVKDAHQGSRFVRALEKYAKYRPDHENIPFRGIDAPWGQVTARCGAPILWVTDDGTDRPRVAADTDPGYWGVRYSVRPLEQRGAKHRLPGSA